MRKFRISLAILFTLSLMSWPLAQSASAACQPVKAKGATIGTISIGSVSAPIKSFNYPAGGVMEPQKTTLAAGLSARHMPLSSTVGTSVIVWHRDYAECLSPLNIFMEKKVGDTFSITDENGAQKRYRLTTVRVIDKGDYKRSWFTLIGPRQIALFTCTGVLKSGHYEKNMVFIATPAA